MTIVTPELAAVVKGLTTHIWGDFFFTIPVFVNESRLIACELTAANSARVVIPDSAISRSKPWMFGMEAWDAYGLIGLKNFKGSLIPLKVVKEINPSFDYKTILHHAVRRQEYEQMVVQHIAEIQQSLSKL